MGMIELYSQTFVDAGEACLGQTPFVSDDEKSLITLTAGVGYRRGKFNLF
jgi:hypothetical protein